jgi:uncharacterized Zn-binding protein involved in type VI secretion
VEIAIAGRGDGAARAGDHFVCPQLSPVPDEAVASVSRLIERLMGR